VKVSTADIDGRRLFHANEDCRHCLNESGGECKEAVSNWELSWGLKGCEALMPFKTEGAILGDAELSNEPKPFVFPRGRSGKDGTVSTSSWTVVI